jgi:hypothetical protein
LDWDGKDTPIKQMIKYATVITASAFQSILVNRVDESGSSGWSGFIFLRPFPDKIVTLVMHTGHGSAKPLVGAGNGVNQFAVGFGFGGCVKCGCIDADCAFVLWLGLDYGIHDNSLL